MPEFAEQNMVSVAAGLAHAGLRPWVYSIAPFIYARAFEQIRNDVCLHDLPVFLVATVADTPTGSWAHPPRHRGLRQFARTAQPHRLRSSLCGGYSPRGVAPDGGGQARVLGDWAATRSPRDFIVPAYAPWRKILSGRGATLMLVGPLAGGILAAVQTLPESQRPNLWVLSELPIITRRSRLLSFRS